MYVNKWKFQKLPSYLSDTLFKNMLHECSNCLKLRNDATSVKIMLKIWNLSDTQCYIYKTMLHEFIIHLRLRNDATTVQIMLKFWNWNMNLHGSHVT
jgi:hypothetical protein